MACHKRNLPIVQTSTATTSVCWSVNSTPQRSICLKNWRMFSTSTPSNFFADQQHPATVVHEAARIGVQTLKSLVAITLKNLETIKAGLSTNPSDSRSQSGTRERA